LFSLKSNLSGSSNVAIGREALQANTASNNTAVGYQALYTSTSLNNTAVGYSAGYSLSSGEKNTIMGLNAGYYLTTGSRNTFIGTQNSNGASGWEITTGSANAILGGYTGNNDGLDIRTASNYAVISDGDGNRQITMKEGQTLALDSAVPNAGTGITFPATQSASSNANTLDDYEEGTFTADLNIGGATTGITYTGRAGKYTKIGNLVYVSLGVTLSSKGSLTGSITISGLPFASANTDYREPYWRGTSNNFADFSATITTSSTTLLIRVPTTTADLTNTTLANNSVLFVNGCYQV
jgi:hypothetical protein